MDVTHWGATLKNSYHENGTPFKFMDLRMERIVHACSWLPLEVAVPALFAAISQPGMCNLVSWVYWDDGPERTARV